MKNKQILKIFVLVEIALDIRRKGEEEGKMDGEEGGGEEAGKEGRLC